LAREAVAAYSCNGLSLYPGDVFSMLGELVGDDSPYFQTDVKVMIGIEVVYEENGDECNGSLFADEPGEDFLAG
jgi:hypothetical protein